MVDAPLSVQKLCTNNIPLARTHTGADVNAQEHFRGATPLHLVLAGSSYKTSGSKWEGMAQARLLLDSGADPEIRDCEGNAAMHMVSLPCLCVKASDSDLNVVLGSEGVAGEQKA